MARRGKSPSRLSYAGQEPGLRQGTPVSLSRLRAVRPEFDRNRDPYVRAQLKAMEKTESQRRGESGRGSGMVRLHRPFPELRPKYEQGPIRASFNQAWLKEQREAQLVRFEAERANDGKRTEAALDRPCQTRARTR